MKAREMTEAFNELFNNYGVNLDEMANSLYTTTGASGCNTSESIISYNDNATVSYILPKENYLVIDNSSPYVTIESGYYKPRRLKCVYCDCISSKESGTCEHCGAPLIEDEY